MPTAFVAGKYDVLASSKDIRAAAERTAGATYVELWGTHYLPLERSAEVTALLRELVDPCGGCLALDGIGRAYAADLARAHRPGLGVGRRPRWPRPSCWPAGSPRAQPTSRTTPRCGRHAVALAAAVDADRDAADPSEPTRDRAARTRPRSSRTVARGLEAPWGVTFLPDGTALVGERDTTPGARRRRRRPGPRGRAWSRRPARRVRPGCWGSPRPRRTTGTGWSTPTSPPRRTTGSCGSRYDGAGSAPSSRCSPASPTGSSTTAGGCSFADDGTLFVSTGETGEPGSPRTPTSLGGKILRITPDGRAGAGQPRPGLAGVDAGAPQRAGPGVRRRGPALGHRVRPEHLGRAQPHRAEPQLRLAVRRGPRRRRRGSATRSSPGAPTTPRRRGWPSLDGSLWAGALNGERLWEVPVTADGARASRGAGSSATTAGCGPSSGRARRQPLGDDLEPGRPRRPAAEDDRILEIALP